MCGFAYPDKEYEDDTCDGKTEETRPPASHRNKETFVTRRKRGFRQKKLLDMSVDVECDALQAMRRRGVLPLRLLSARMLFSHLVIRHS
jgi:hypothetical protein